MGYFMYSPKRVHNEIQRDKRVENKPMALIVPPPPPLLPDPPLKKDMEVQKEEPMLEQQPVDKIEEPEKISESPEDFLGTNITGNGPDMGLGRGMGSKPMGFIGKNKASSEWDKFAVLTQNTMSREFRENMALRTQRYIITIKIWVEPDGSITRCLLKNSTGSSLIDKALKDQIISKIKLSIPPKNMPMPITIRVSSR